MRKQKKKQANLQPRLRIVNQGETRERGKERKRQKELRKRGRGRSCGSSYDESSVFTSSRYTIYVGGRYCAGREGYRTKKGREKRERKRRKKVERGREDDVHARFEFIQDRDSVDKRHLYGECKKHDPSGIPKPSGLRREID